MRCETSGIIIIKWFHDGCTVRDEAMMKIDETKKLPKLVNWGGSGTVLY